MAHSYTSADDDLEGLYDEVWASFTEEPPVAHQQELDSSENAHPSHEQSGPANAPNSRRRHDSPFLYVSNLLDCADPHPTVSTTAFKHPQEALPVSPGRSARPLPPTPGSPTSAASTAFVVMPEPEPYDPSVVRAGHHTVDSYGSGSSDLRRKATTASAHSRRYTPGTPISSPRLPLDNGVHTGPTEPTQYALPRTMSHSSYGSSNGASYPDSVSRESSYRPSSIPGVQGVDNNPSPAIDGRSINSGDWYRQGNVNPFENKPSGGTGISGVLQNQPNQEYMAQVRHSSSFTGDTFELSCP